MSLTHYWRPLRPFSHQEWPRILDAAGLICSRAAGGGIELTVSISEKGIVLNGPDNSGCEDFVLTPPDNCEANDKYRNVKTAWRPYDLAVCAILIAVSEIAPTAIDLKSDGKWDDQNWRKARSFYQELFEVEPNQPF